MANPVDKYFKCSSVDTLAVNDDHVLFIRFQPAAGAIGKINHLPKNINDVSINFKWLSSRSIESSMQLNNNRFE